MGVLDRLFPPINSRRRREAYVQALVDGAASAIGAIKLAVHRGRDRALDDALRIEREMLEVCFAAPTDMRA